MLLEPLVHWTRSANVSGCFCLTSASSSLSWRLVVDADIWWWMSFPKLQFCRQFMTREVYIPSCLLNSFIITGVQTALRSSSVFLMNRDRSRKRLLSHVERTVTKISKKGIPRQDPAKWSNFYSLALVYLDRQFINLSGDTTRHKETKIFTKKVFLMTEYQRVQVTRAKEKVHKKRKQYWLLP